MIIIISKTYRPPRPGTGIAQLFFFFTLQYRTANSSRRPHLLTWVNITTGCSTELQAYCTALCRQSLRWVFTLLKCLWETSMGFVVTELILSECKPDNEPWKLNDNTSHLHECCHKKRLLITLWPSGLAPCSLVADIDVSKKHATSIFETSSSKIETQKRMV
jgi:hypothetical protein